MESTKKSTETVSLEEILTIDTMAKELVAVISAVRERLYPKPKKPYDFWDDHCF